MRTKRGNKKQCGESTKRKKMQKKGGEKMWEKKKAENMK